MAELVSRLRSVPDRVLHRLRRQRVLGTLRRRRRPTSLLVVCHGNVCRSPFGAALLRQAFAVDGPSVDSGGLIAPGRAAPREAITAAARYGADLSIHRSQLLTAARVETADLILVMDPAQRRMVCDRFGRAARDVLVLGDLDPAPTASRAIRDPVNQRLEVFDEAYARIERCVRELVRAIG